MKRSRLPLSALLDSASSQLQAHLIHKKESAPVSVAGTPAHAGIIFSGNPHEAVPRRLLLDDRLTPLERNTWQVFRLLISGDGVTAFPTYDQLRPYLGMHPGKTASRETISKSLVTLRLTRWLSLGRRVRSDLSGRVQGNVYLLHDEPVSPAEAIELDQDYLQLLSQSMHHTNKAVRDVAQMAWNEFAADPDVGHRLPTRMDVFEERLNAQCPVASEHPGQESEVTEFGIRTLPVIPEINPSSESEPSPNSVTGDHLELSSDSQRSLNPGSSDSVRNPNSYSTYTNTNKDVCKSFVQVQAAHMDLESEWLQAIHALPSDKKEIALGAVHKVPADLKAAVLGQWVHRVSSGSIRNPVGYLLTLVSSAVRGEFNTAWTPESLSPTPESSPMPREAAPVVPDQAPSGSPNQPPAAKSPEALATAQREINAMINQLRFGRPDAR